MHWPAYVSFAATSTILPLRRDSASRFLPWIIGFMAYLATLALAGFLLLDATAERWAQAWTGTLTVQLMPVEGMADGERIGAALELLRATPDVLEATPLSDADIAALLRPWLGPGDLARDLPLPRLIDVTLAPDSQLDLGALGERLAAAVSGATIDDPNRWLADFASLGRAARAIAAGVFLLVVAAAVATVVFITRMGLAVHQEVIDVLHLIGARDSFVARQFQNHALILGLRGSLLGLGLAVVTLLVIGRAASRLEAPFLPAFVLEPWNWGAIAALPLLTALIAMLTARLTTLYELARLP